MQPHHGRSFGSIEVVCGPMFSGKTEELIRRLRLAQIAKQRVQIFKPAIDNRYAEEFIMSHNEQKFLCQPVADPAAILAAVRDSTRVVGIDEAQFFTADLVQACEKLANRGIRVIVAGLDQDYRGLPFGPMPQLLAIADFATKSQAVCVACGGVATKTQRLTGDDAQVVVGSGELYEARCRSCFDPDFTLADARPATPVSRQSRVEV